MGQALDADWITSPSARRVVAFWADPRPAWLWRGDGGRLIWRNPAAGAFEAERTGGAGDAVPIKGQVARLIRLGIMGRASPANLQFLVGGRPVSLTCQCTPLLLEGGAPGLLIVASEERMPLPAPWGGASDPMIGALLQEGMRHVVTTGSGEGAGDVFPAGLPEVAPGETSTLALPDGPTLVTRLPAGPDGASLWLLQPAAEERSAPAALPAEPAPAAPPSAEAAAPVPEAATATVGPEVREDDDGEPRDRSLSTLFDRLAQDADLYRSLETMPEAEEEAPADVRTPAAEDQLDEDFEAAAAPATPGEAAASIAPAEPGETAEGGDGLYRITGRGFEPLEAEGDNVPAESAATTTTPPAERRAGTLDRVSRYNFDELSRILTDRVGGDAAHRQPPADRSGEATAPTTPRAAAPEAPSSAEAPTAPLAALPPAPAPTEPPAPARPPPPAATQPEGQLVSLAGEAFILNRLPLGILVFRDQSVLFANRSITEMVGFQSVEELRNAGLGSIFPAAGEDVQAAGPVNHLVQRDGTLVPVTARLQSISWQGKPALMLSASATEVRTGHEAAVRAYAELVAEQRHEGFIDALRNGVVSRASARACRLLGLEEPQVVGKPLSALIAPTEGKALREFLERPARFAETARPAIVLAGAAHDLELHLFAQGQAGIVSGYFGQLRRRHEVASPALPAGPEADPALLARLSRGVRRPLNTIVGFADLIRSAAFGSVGNERYVQYAADIRTAGEEIAVLVEELDEYTRLREGRYATRPASIDLGALLDSCVLRVRVQAGSARVLVRSAVSERLPRVRADRASLGQAVLNLLASAIDQTPPGGSVILSARAGEDGTISINVRDSAATGGDPGERFVVFRDGVGTDGRNLAPIRSSVGLALTQSLAEVNACSLSVEPLREGTLFSLVIPAENVVPALPRT